MFARKPSRHIASDSTPIQTGKIALFEQSQKHVPPHPKKFVEFKPENDESQKLEREKDGEISSGCKKKGENLYPWPKYCHVHSRASIVATL